MSLFSMIVNSNPGYRGRIRERERPWIHHGNPEPIETAISPARAQGALSRYEAEETAGNIVAAQEMLMTFAPDDFARL